MERGDKIISAILLLPAVVWSLDGINTLLENGLYSYTFLFPFPFKIHTFTLLSATTFYLTAFLIIKPHRPIKNFLISSSFIFLSMAIYEFVYFIFMINTSMPALPPPSSVPPPLPFPLSAILGILTGPGSIHGVLLGIILLYSLNQQFHFLTSDKGKTPLFLMCFSGFIAVMLVLNHMGFFTQMHLYLSGQTTNDPHNPLWIISKILCTWMFLPLLVSCRFRRLRGFL